MVEETKVDTAVVVTEPHGTKLSDVVPPGSFAQAARSRAESDAASANWLRRNVRRLWIAVFLLGASCATGMLLSAAGRQESAPLNSHRDLQNEVTVLEQRLAAIERRQSAAAAAAAAAVASDEYASYPRHEHVYLHSQLRVQGTDHQLHWSWPLGVCRFVVMLEGRPCPARLSARPLRVGGEALTLEAETDPVLFGRFSTCRLVIRATGKSSMLLHCESALAVRDEPRGKRWHHGSAGALLAA